MPITEFALLRLKQDITPTSPLLKSHLSTALHAMQSFAGSTFRYYTILEDPQLIAIIGQWVSLSQHMDDFIPSKANQDLLKALGPMVDIDTFFHIDVPNGDLPLDAPVIAAGRMTLKHGQKDEFAQWMDANRRILQAEVLSGTRVGGGWRIEREKEGNGADGSSREEYVLFSGWATREDHFGFAQKESFETWKGVMGFVEKADIKHFVRLNVESKGE